MSNELNITAANAGEIHGLHGDMQPVLNFTPNSNAFDVGFFVLQEGSYVISSTTGTFRQPDGSTGPTLTLSGVNRFVLLMFNAAADVWEMPLNNLVGGGGGGSGTPGAAANISLGTVEIVAADQPLQISMTGPSTDRKLNFKWPANGGGSGSGLPPGGQIGQVVVKTGTADGAAGWGNQASGNGTGEAFSPEVEIQQASDGTVTFNAVQGTRFRVKLVRNGKFLAPQGYNFGQTIKCSIWQGEQGPFTMEWDLAWAHPNRAVPTLATQPGGLTKLSADYTGSLGVGFPECWETDVTPPGSATGYGVPSFIARNLTTGTGYYILRGPTGPAGMTELQNGQTLKILRNGLGVEAYGGIEQAAPGAMITVSGALPNGKRAELRTGPGIRAAFDRGVIAVGRNAKVTIQDLILSGAREQSGGAHAAQGLSLTGNSEVWLNNVVLTDNENGCLSGNLGNANPADDYTGTIHMFNCDVYANAVGDDGLTHGIYMGHSNADWDATQTTFRGNKLGHNVKSRAAVTRLTRVITDNSETGREIELPNGGRGYFTDGRSNKYANAAQNDMVRIADEGVDTSRPREYIFKRWHFYNEKGGANQSSFIWNEDPDVDVICEDCTFESPNAPGHQWAGSDANGMRGRVIVRYTSGPQGPQGLIGVQPMAVTPV